MATITAIKTVGVTSITEIVAAGRNFGYDNVTCNWFSDIIDDSLRNGFSVEDYTELFSKANKETLQAMLSSVFRSEDFIDEFAGKIGIPSAQLVEELTKTAIDKHLYIEIPSVQVSIEQLNTLAEEELISLYHVERVKSIDVEFVQKYHEHLDMRSLLRLSEKPEVRTVVENILA
jgi:hypothetical protein